jgi:histone-lysine N-methyltransferase SETMAR
MSFSVTSYELQVVKPGFHLWMLKTKNRQNHGCTPCSPDKPKKFKQTVFTRKQMETVFWYRKRVLMVGFVQRGTVVMSEVYCKTLKWLRRAIQNKRYRLLTSGVVLLHYSACLHTAARTQALLEYFNWELFDHPPYSPDLTLSDYHLFTYLNNW